MAVYTDVAADELRNFPWTNTTSANLAMSYEGIAECVEKFQLPAPHHLADISSTLYESASLKRAAVLFGLMTQSGQPRIILSGAAGTQARGP
jgi:hypothetical protein